jgi:hypothetical protein
MTKRLQPISSNSADALSELLRGRTMAMVRCKQCNTEFDSTNHLKTSGAFAAGAAAGAWFGSGVGLAGGPLGAMAGTIPGALIGGTLAALGISKVVQCPSCDNVFLV